MFHRLQRLDETTHTHNGVTYEIRIFKSADDGHLRVYVSTDALSDMVEAKAIGEWLKRPNPAFEGSTPLQVIERGETDRIWRMIWELQSGNTG